MRLDFAMWINSTRGRFQSNMAETDKIDDISTSCSPPGWQGVSKKRERPTEFEFLGFRCDHEVLKALEAKNGSKTGVFDEIWLFLRCFWLLAPFKLHGRT